MSQKKNLIEDALIQLQEVQKRVSENGEEILSLTMKEEIDQLVQESISKTGVSNKKKSSGNIVEGKKKGKKDSEETTEADDDIDDTEDDEINNLEGDEEDELEDLDDLEGDEEDELEDLDDLEGDEEDELEDFQDMDGDDDVIDARDWSSDETLKVFKKLDGEDKIVVTRDGDNLNIKDTDTDSEYIIQLSPNEIEMFKESFGDGEFDYMDEGDEFDDMDFEDDEFEDDGFKELDDYEDDEFSDMDFEDDEFDDMDFEDDEPIVGNDLEEKMYEIEMSEEEDDDTKVEKKETKEASRTLGNGKKWGRNGLKKPRTAPRHLEVESKKNSKTIDSKMNMTIKKLMNENKALKEKNGEYIKALKQIKDKLTEVAVFNSNLAYAVRLFTEHSTTKSEKLNIIKRFDDVNTIKESKSTYRRIKNELNKQGGKNIVEEQLNKINKTHTSGATKLHESKTYENPQFARIKDLMKKIR